MIARRAWVVLADRREARFFFHAAPGEKFVDASAGRMTFEPAKADADRPGRVHDRSGDHRHGMEATTSADVAEREQAGRAVADALLKGHEEDGFDRVVLVATPGIIGAIRPHLSPAVRDKVVAEVHHRLLDLKPHELADRMSAEEVIGRVAR